MPKRAFSRSRQVAEELAIGHSTGDVAKRFGLTPGRISQMRRELHQSWEEFHQGSPEDRPISEDA